MNPRNVVTMINIILYLVFVYFGALVLLHVDYDVHRRAFGAVLVVAGFVGLLRISEEDWRG